MFIPVNKQDMLERGWDELDFIYILGDAYVDHPSFGAAIITRVLEAFGYKIGIIPHPDIKNDESFKVLGTPKIGFMISAGNIDTMVNMYTSNKRRRGEDLYQESGDITKRPKDATITYTKIVKRLFPNKPVIIGGIEASLRRLAHYDYIKDDLSLSFLDSYLNLGDGGGNFIAQMQNMILKTVTTVTGYEPFVFCTTEKGYLYGEAPNISELKENLKEDSK